MMKHEVLVNGSQREFAMCVVYGTLQGCPEWPSCVRLSSEARSDSEDASLGESAEAKAPEGAPGELLLAYLAGKMRLHRIRVLVGDQVEMVLDPYGGRARIVRRLT